MIERVVTVKNQGGIHARPAGIIVKMAQQYQSDIYFIHNEKVIKAKGIMALIAAGISSGNELKIICSGVDEKEAMQAFNTLFANRFGED